MIDLLLQPVKKMTDDEIKAMNKRDLAELLASDHDIKRRVLKFLENNYTWSIADIVKKFNLSHDVAKDYGNGLVKLAFFASESMRVICFELTMPYSEVLATWGKKNTRNTL